MTGRNEEQIRFWNEDGGSVWVDYQDGLDALLAPLGEELIRVTSAQPGERILEVGCGTGYTAIQLARQATVSGLVLGVDVSRAMLESARRRDATGTNIQFLEADAQTEDLGVEIFDAAVSRFGVMFFDDPAVAFANLRRALKPGGRLVFVCWQSPAVNAWIREPMAVMAQHLELPEPPPPDSPGPFSLADPDRLSELLSDAGFPDLDIVPFTCQIILGRDVEAAVDFMANVGPTSRVLREANEAAREGATAALRTALDRHSGGGPIAMDAASWLVTARRDS